MSSLDARGLGAGGNITPFDLLDMDLCRDRPGPADMLEGPRTLGVRLLEYQQCIDGHVWDSGILYTSSPLRLRQGHGNNQVQRASQSDGYSGLD